MHRGETICYLNAMRFGEASNRWGTKPAAPRESKGKIGDSEPWTDDELARLREYRADGMSPRLVSEKLNRTLKAVEAKIAELKAVRR
jgi:hypothetical protein